MTWLPGLFPILAGFTLWSVGFVALYGLQGLGCAYGWSSGDIAAMDLHRLVLVATYAVVVAGGGFLVWRSWRARRGAAGPHRMIEWVGLALNVSALGASIFVFTPLFGTSACT